MSALFALALVAAPAARAAPAPRMVVAFVDRADLAGLARVPGASIGLMSATQGRYTREQALLDMTQGSRTASAAYRPEAVPPLAIAGARVLRWGAVVRRARAAPAQIVPGLLGASVPGGAMFAGEGGRLEAVLAAGRDGRLRSARAGGAALVVTVLPDVAALVRLVRGREPGTLVLAIGTPPRAGTDPRLLPVAAVGLGAGRELTSTTTRVDGLVAGIDVLPTILHRLGRAVPGGVSGEPLRASGRTGDASGLGRLAGRLGEIGARRLPALGVLCAAWLALLAALAVVGGRAGARRAARAGGLAVLWLPAVLLASAALAPSAAVEEGGVAVACLGLGALTDALVGWPRAPAVPCGVALLAHVIDLAFGSPLIDRSLLGPDPIAGARFYGIGNELEAVLPVLALVGVAAALGGRARSRGTALAFALAGLLLAGAIGPAALGADVGGVITVGAGTAVAVLLAAPGRLTRRRVVLALVVPVAGVAALVAVDLATGGNGHLTRTVLRAGSSTALGDVVVRRYELAFDVLRSGVMPLLTALALVLVTAGVRLRARLLDGVPGAPAWRAALVGAAAAGVAGALANDSGPVLLVYASATAGAAAGYLRAGIGPRG